jgi:hypothetical protein
LLIFKYAEKPGTGIKEQKDRVRLSVFFRENAVIFIDTHRPRFYTVLPVQPCSYEAGRETVCFAVFSFYAGNDKTF